MIDVINATKKYRDSKKHGKKKTKYVLDDISIKFRDGKITALLGINGAGKTTLLKAIAGLVNLNKGTILIDDKKFSYKNYNELTFVPDYDIHFAGFSVKEMMSFYENFYKNWDQNKANQMLVFFDIDKEAYIDDLSKGNIAKVKLVFAFSQNAKYILFDEPFSGIDLFKREEFVKIIKKYMVEDQTILIATHEISEIENLVDDVYFLSEGKVLFYFDAKEEIERKGKTISEKIREVAIREGI